MSESPNPSLSILNLAEFDGTRDYEMNRIVFLMKLKVQRGKEKERAAMMQERQMLKRKQAHSARAVAWCGVKKRCRGREGTGEER